MMQTDISQQIKNINECIEWVKQHKPADYDEKYLQLVEQRRRLKQVAEAEKNNPGIAAFGKSQVGKSYLIGCLLKDNGKPFMVYSGDKAYDFVLKINPPSDEGGGKESTGVVSRFSSMKRNIDMYNKDLPVLVKCFTLADIVTILADSYFKDMNYKSLTQPEIEEFAQKVYTDYATKSDLECPLITSDDVLAMKSYFKKYINHAQVFTNVPFFDKIALVIEKIPVSKYVNVFACIWNNNEHITQLYNKLYDILSRYNFPRFLYLPIEAVLHNETKENTIMSVQCLKQLLSEKQQYFTDVYLKIGDKYEKRGSNVPKSEICSICSEVIFKIEDSFLQSSGKYDFTYIGDDVKDSLNHGEIKMEMLRDNDLLDFPGARAREEEKLETMSNNDTLLTCFLRGKVAYLFNKYNEEMTINILLYCHHHKDNDVTGLYKLIEKWVNNYVGKTFEDRNAKLQTTKVSPLFYIGTMFNLDMQLGIGSEITEHAINQRWTGRFDTVVNSQCFHINSVDWVKNFTKNGESFKNSYMLRDFKFSGPNRGLYRGFVDDLGRNIIGTEETEMIMDSDYLKIMRKTFAENIYCKQFFDNPALSFDVAATMNNDGSLYILENLKTAAENIGTARENDFQKVCNEVATYVDGVMRQYYVPEDANQQLAENLRKADEIRNDMLLAKHDEFNYFGMLLRKLQISESEIYNKLKTEILGNLHQMVFSFKENYTKILRETDYFEGCKDEEEKWRLFLDCFKFDGNTYEEQKQKAVEYLDSHNIDKDRLFAADVEKHINSAVIAREILKRWIDSISPLEREYGVTLGYIIQCYKTVAKSLNIQGQIESEIAPYTDIPTGNIVQIDLIADIISTIINKFVLDFGYARLSALQKERASNHINALRYKCFSYLDKPRKEDYSEEEMSELFNKYLVSDGSDIPSTDETQQKWLAYMFYAFVANLDAGDYDKAANDKLKQLLDKINA